MNNDEKQKHKVEDRNFESEVVRSKQPVLVAFLTAWSQPCQMLKPVLEEVATAYAGQVKVITLNADDDPSLGLVYAIQFIPTLLVFVDGKVRARIVGTASAEAILSKLRSVLGCGESGKTKDTEGNDNHE